MENDLQQVMEASVNKRDGKKVAQVWSQIYNQLQEWETGSSRSLFGEDTPSMEIGNLQKRFAKVNEIKNWTSDLNLIVERLSSFGS